MKKIGVLVCITFCWLSLHAQDIIYKTDSTRIEALILRVDDEHIEYKRWTNQQGPTFSISVGKVDKIIYSNGEVERMNSTSTQSSTQNNNYQSDITNTLLLTRIADLEAKADHLSTIEGWVGVIGGLGVLGAWLWLGPSDFSLGNGLLCGLSVGAYELLVILLFEESANAYRTQAKNLRSQLNSTAMLDIKPAFTLDRTTQQPTLGLSLTLNF